MHLSYLNDVLWLPFVLNKILNGESETDLHHLNIMWRGGVTVKKEMFLFQ